MMKSARSNDCAEINVSVIGLSGNETTKGVRGVGKSCLCNRLSQPGQFRTRHSSVVSSIDFLGSDLQDRQCTYWGSVSRESVSRKYNVRVLEQTVMVDDISHQALCSKDEYVSRATTTDLRGTRQVHVIGGSHDRPAVPLSGKNTVHLFILVYDVSEVEGRNPDTQDSMFRQLFDRAIITKRPLVIVATKHDIASYNIVARLAAMLDKRPYCKYPVVEISATMDVNVSPLFDLVLCLHDGGLKSLKQRVFHFHEAFMVYQKRLEQCRDDVRKLVTSILDSDLWHSSWIEVKKIPQIEKWVKNLGSDLVMATFEDVRMDVRLKRRVKNQQRHKDSLVRLLTQFDHLLPSVYNNIAVVVQGLTKDPDFMSHFVPFNKDAEYFDFNNNSHKLPLYILDSCNENNLIFVIQEHIDQKNLQDQLFQRLIVDCPGNFRKSLKVIGDDLRHYMKHFIPEKIIVSARDRFLEHYMHVLKKQFLEILEESPNLFWSQGIFKYIDITPEKPWKINGLSRSKATLSTDPVLHDNNTSFLSNMVKEINSKIHFPPVDEEQTREAWIYEYLNFLLSANEFDCIYRQVTQGPCNSSMVNDLLSESGLDVETDVVNLPHIFYLVVVGDSVMKNKLSGIILASQGTLELCKVHSTKYELRLLEDIGLLKVVQDELSTSGDRCCTLGLLLCTNMCQDNDEEENDLDQKEVSLLLDQRGLYTGRVTSYVVYSVTEELIRVAPYQGSVREAYLNANVIHISTLISNLKSVVEPSIIWVVTVCGDLIDYGCLFEGLIKVLKYYSIPKRMNSAFVTVAGSFTSRDVDNRTYRLCFISYHQAIKLLIRSSAPPPVDGLLLICSMDRLASLNICLGIKKYLPKEMKSFCHSMMLGIVTDSDAMTEKASSKAAKEGIKFCSLKLEGAGNSSSGLGPEVESHLLDFLSTIFKGSLVSESLEDLSTATSSLQYERKGDGSGDPLCQYRCRSCGQCRSNENVNSNFLLSDSHNDSKHKFRYDQILGDNNEDLFRGVRPEFRFNIAQDTSSKCTEVKCTIHVLPDSNGQLSYPFRTRIRSQSGPDLRNLASDSTKTSSRQSDVSGTAYCLTCGAKMSSSYSAEGSSSEARKPLASKSSLDKDSPSKKFANMIQDIFSATKKTTDVQSQDQRKTFVRASSKRRK